MTTNEGIKTSLDETAASRKETKFDGRFSTSNDEYRGTEDQNPDNESDENCFKVENESQTCYKNEEQDLTANTKPSALIPPDGGWGWLVTFGSVINIFLTAAIIPCFSILYYETLVSFGSSSATVAWVFNSHMFIWNVLGLWVMPLVSEFGWRKVATFGILCISSSFIISAFAVSARFLFFSFSLLSGLGSGIVAGICFNIVPLYFDRRRGLSNAIIMAGISIGQILGPPLVRYLQEEYSSKGALLIMGAIILNGLVGITFFHPVNWHLKPNSIVEAANSLQIECNDLSQGNKINVSNKFESDSSEKFLKPVDNEIDELIDNTTAAIKKVERLRKKRGLSESSNYSVTSAEMAVMCSSNMNVAVPGVENVDNSYEQGKEKGINTQKQSSCAFITIIARVGRSVVSNLKIMCYRRAMLINLGIALLLNAQVNFIMMVPFAMRAAGFTLQDASYAISVMGTVNMTARLCVSPLSDFKWFNMTFVYMTGQAFMAAMIFVFPFVEDLMWIYVVMAMYGFGIGVTICFNYLIMIKYLGIEKLGPTLGASCVCVALGFIISGPFIGFVRDATQSYAISMWILSSMVSSSFLLWFFMPAAVAYDRRRHLKKVESNIP